jgi:hypothetical protein
MPLALLLLTLANPGAPLRPDLYQTHLTAPPGVLLPAVASSRGGEIYGGVRNTVAGSILCVLGGAIGAGGLYSLISAANETGSSKTVFTVLGWTFGGMGAVLLLVGIPLLIVGIVQLSHRPGSVGLGLDQHGQLAVTF